MCQPPRSSLLFIEFAIMQYRILLPDAPASDGDPTGDFKSVGIADKWTRQWLTANAATDRYRLVRDDGGFAATYIKAVTGQWYIHVDKGYTLAD